MTWARPADEAVMIFDFGKRKAEERVIELLEARICFDHKKNKKCEHAVCFNNSELVAIVKKGI